MKLPYVLALAAMLCAGHVAAANAVTPADQLLVGMNMNNVLTLDPAAATGNDVMPVAANLYDFLVELDPHQVTHVLPGLAESWTISADRRRIDFTLRAGVTFQSGDPLTAEDAAWSLQRTVKMNRALASPWKSYGFSAQNIDTLVRATDDRTLSITLPHPVDPTLVIYTLATSIGAAVLDRREVLAHARGNDYGGGWLATHAAGSGAFALAEWKPEDVMILTRNATYWRGPAKLRRVVLRHIPESQALRFMLDRDDVDLALGLSAPDLVAMRQDPHVDVMTVATGAMYYVALSMQSKPFADARVREAVRSLIDYDGINRYVMAGYGVPHQRPVQAGLPGSLPDPGYRLDVSRARALLAQAGYAVGFDTTIRVLADPPFLNIATSLQATLAQAGIRAQVITGTGNQVYGAMRDRRFDIVVGRGGGGLEPDPFSNVRALVYNPDNRDAAKLTNFQGWRTGFADEQINRWFASAQADPDPQSQAKLYQAIQQRYAELVGPILPVSQSTNTVVVRRGVVGYVPSPVWTTRLWAVGKTS